MKTIVGVDVADGTLRWSSKDAAGATTQDVAYAISGCVPLRPRERVAWLDSRLARSSLADTPMLSLADAWAAVRGADGAVSWTLPDGTTGRMAGAEAVGECLVDRLGDLRHARMVVAIDNWTEEEEQDRLIRGLGAKGLGGAELLWRPVALLLGYLHAGTGPNAGSIQLKENAQFLVVDLEAGIPEFTVLSIVKHDGVLLPLRVLARRRRFESGWSARQVREALARAVADGWGVTERQLTTGNGGACFAAALEACGSDVWIRQGLAFVCRQTPATLTQEAVRLRAPEHTLEDVLYDVRAYAKENPCAAVLIHGWPARSPAFTSAIAGANVVVLDPHAVANGCRVYADFLEQDRPAYLDSLPGLYILSRVPELNALGYFKLVDPRERVVGGKEWRLPEPFARLSLKKEIPKASAFLRRSDWPNPRKLTMSLADPPASDVPLLVTCSMKPAQGRAKVRLAARDGQPVFDGKPDLLLDWDGMEKTEIPMYVAPSVYPVKGRIHDEPEARAALVAFLQNGCCTYKGCAINNIALFGDTVMQPHRHPGEQYTRGLFGALMVDDPEVHTLTQKLRQKINDSFPLDHTDRIKYLNYMFGYTDPDFAQHLRDVYRQPNPCFDALTPKHTHMPSWNYAFAVGRVFTSASDFTIFLRFLQCKSLKAGFPDYPDGSFANCFIWSFFRCLCYHEETAAVDADIVLDVLRAVIAYAGAGFPGVQPRGIRNARKYVMYAILFALRLRSREPMFLQPGDPSVAPLLKDLLACLQVILPGMPFPGAMVGTHVAGSLNDYVVRFLLQQATQEDYQALEGLVATES